MKASGQLKPPHSAPALPEAEPSAPAKEVQMQLGRVAEASRGANQGVPAEHRQKRTGEVRRDRLR